MRLCAISTVKNIREAEEKRKGGREEGRKGRCTFLKPRCAPVTIVFSDGGKYSNRQRVIFDCLIISV